MTSKKPDLSLLDDTVAPKVLAAMRTASEELARIGVRHLVVGGLAVGAYGYARATKDVDFLVADEAFDRHGGGIVTMKPGVPIQVNGVAIDHLSADESETAVRDVLAHTTLTPLQLAPIEILIWLKLKSPRAKDRTDIVELIKAGIDVERCRAFLTKNADGLLPDFESAIGVAAREEQL